MRGGAAEDFLAEKDVVNRESMKGQLPNQEAFSSKFEQNVGATLCGGPGGQTRLFAFWRQLKGRLTTIIVTIVTASGAKRSQF